MNDIYLVRHGLIDDKTLMLNEDGNRFAQELVTKLKDKRINFIASSTELRCIETVIPFAKDRKLQIKTYDKVDFINLKPLQDARLHNDSNTLICYRIEEVNSLLNALGLPKFTDQTRDAGYEIIIHLTIEGGQTTRQLDISTGHKKKSYN